MPELLMLPFGVELARPSEAEPPSPLSKFRRACCSSPMAEGAEVA